MYNEFCLIRFIFVVKATEKAEREQLRRGGVLVGAQCRRDNLRDLA